MYGKQSKIMEDGKKCKYHDSNEKKKDGGEIIVPFCEILFL